MLITYTEAIKLRYYRKDAPTPIEKKVSQIQNTRELFADFATPTRYLNVWIRPSLPLPWALESTCDGTNLDQMRA